MGTVAAETTTTIDGKLPAGPVYSITPLHSGKRYAWVVWPSRTAAESAVDSSVEWTPPLSAGETMARDEAQSAVEAIAPSARKIAASYALAYPTAERHEVHRTSHWTQFGYALRSTADAVTREAWRDELPRAVRAVQQLDTHHRRALVELLRAVHQEETGEDLALRAKPAPLPPPRPPRRTVISFAEVQEWAASKRANR